MLRALQCIQRGLAPFLRWWVAELCGLAPAPLRRLVSGPRRRIIVAVDPLGLAVFEERRGQLRSIGPSSGSAEPCGPGPGALAELARSTPRVPIGVRLPFDACFARRVALPATAQNDFGRMLSLDLERTTPFRADDVYASHFVEEPIGDRGTVRVRQVVVKRAALDPAIADIEAIGLRVSFADCWGEDGRAGLPVNFLEPTRNIAGPFGRQLHPNALLVGLAFVLVCSAIFLVVHKHENALAQLQRAIVHARSEAQNVRRTLDGAEAAFAQMASLRQIKLESIPVVHTLEELSRLLPDSAWLTELRIEKDSVELSGLAKSAADLLPILERSPVFTDAELAAPLTLDPREDKEHFSIRIRIRRQTPEHAASGGGRSG